MSKKLFLISFIAMGFIANAYAEYQLAAGQYLPANSETPIDCDQNGYYCMGDQNGVNYSSSAQGLTQCPNGYANSGTGASADTDCFRLCTTNDVAHSSGTVNGGVYYDGTSGDGTSTCEPTACEHGWHVKPAVPDLYTEVGTDGSGYRGYIDYKGDFFDDANKGQSFYGLENDDINSFAVWFYRGGIVRGHSACSEIPGTLNWDEGYFSVEPSITNQTKYGANYCWCRIDGYKPDGGTLQRFDSSWVFRDNSSICLGNCTRYCASTLQNSAQSVIVFRLALFNALGTPGPARCEANTITINWADVDPEYAGQNNEGTATYGGNISTPFKAVTKPGKTFTGWRFSNPNPVPANPEQSGN